MRIVDFLLRRYGPLSDSGNIKLGDFNLFWGENEDGKTLTIEALIKLLFSKGLKSIKGIERVDEKPIGSVRIKFSHNKTLSFPEKINLSELLDISPESFFNIFLIRNSDLSLSDEGKFYTDITERLTGLRKSRIAKIKDRLRKIGRLTRTLEVENKKDSRMLKDRLLKAENFVKRVKEFLLDSEAKKYGRLEEELVKSQEKSAFLSEKLKALKNAKKRQDFEKYSRYLEDFLEISKRYAESKVFNNDEYNKLIQLKNLIKMETERIDEIKAALKVTEEHISLNEAESGEASIRLRHLEKKAARAEETIKPLIKRCDALSQKSEAQNASRKFVLVSMIVSALLMLFSMTGTLLRTSVFFFTTSAVIGTVMLILFGFYIRYLMTGAKLKREEMILINGAAEFGISGNKVDEIRKSFSELNSEVEILREKVANLQNAGSALRDKAGEKRGEIEGSREKIRKFSTEIANILNNLHIKSINEYNLKLKEKSERKSKLDSLFSILKDRFGSIEGSTQDSVAMWRGKIDGLENAARTNKGGEDDRQGQVEFSESIVAEAEKQWAEANNRSEELINIFSSIKKKIEDFKREIDSILQDGPVNFTVESIEDLKYAKERVEEFLNSYKRQKDNVITALNILDEISRREEEKIGSLFGPGSDVSQYYKRITGGLYSSVYYTAEQHRIMVKRKDGTELYPEQLSGGAYDQLYFSIRAALGERLLPDEKGFFILDDPFLKSDSKRIVTQMEMLLSLAESGWQILYFSAKDEVKQHLKKAVDKGKVMLLPIPKTDF